MEMEQIEIVRQAPKGDQCSQDSNDFNNLLIHGDCLAACAYLLSEEIQVDLVYIDPPFLSGTDYAKPIVLRNGLYDSGRNEKIEIGDENLYRDVWEKEDYLDWLRERVSAIRQVMSERATLYLHLDWHIVHYAKVLLDEIFGVGNFVNEIIWHYESGGRAEKYFSRKHDTILCYARNEEYRYFSMEGIGTPRNICYRCGQVVKRRNNMKKQVDPDGRVYRTIRSHGKVYRYYDDELAPPSDVWSDISHLQQKDPEREEYQTQKPEKLVRRIIQAASKEGMIVADFFSGSGTTAKAAHDLGRKFIACDHSIHAIQTTRDRLVRARADFDVYQVVNEGELVHEREPNQVEVVVTGLKDGCQVEVIRFYSPSLQAKIDEYNLRKRKRRRRSSSKDASSSPQSWIYLSENGLELIEAIQFDITLRNDGVWISQLDLEDRARVGERIQGVYNVPSKIFRMKVRSLSGDETVVEGGCEA